MIVSPYRPPLLLLEELGISEPEDIHIEAIAEYCGATIVYEPLEGCEGRILGHGDRAIITVSTRSPRGRQRFSAAHELGHWMRDRGKVAFACSENTLSTEWSADNPERRANRYAVDLLLAEPLFSRYAKNRQITFDTVRELANKFQTSLTPAAIRLVELGSYPAMIICNTPGRRRWFIRGRNVPEVLWPREIPGRYTVAHDLLNRKAEAGGAVDVCADGWFDHQDASRYAVREDSIRIAGELILSLLWWKDERQLLAPEEDDGD